MGSLLMDGEAAVFSFVLALVPALIWLVFWLFEDKKSEPKLQLLLAFVAGMAGVIFVLPLQALAASYLPMGFLLIVLWATIEEIMKLLFAWLAIFRKKVADEPIDMPIYLITTALGFSTLENAFFLFRPLADGHILEGLATGDLRFIGASLMHVLASAIVGGALALAYYQERREKIFYAVSGVILAIALHSIFNSLILSRDAGNILTVFLGVWVGVVFLLLMFERVKGIQRPAWWEKMFMRRTAP